MQRFTGLTAAIGFLMLAAGTTGAAAQACQEGIGEAGAPDRGTALVQAYDAMLRGVDQAAWRQWQARGQRIGEAPGFTVRKLTTNCSPRGAGSFCRVQAVLCR